MLTIKLSELLEKQYGKPVKIRSLKLLAVSDNYVDFEVELVIFGDLDPSRTYVQIQI